MSCRRDFSCSCLAFNPGLRCQFDPTQLCTHARIYDACPSFRQRTSWNNSPDQRLSKSFEIKRQAWNVRHSFAHACRRKCPKLNSEIKHFAELRGSFRTHANGTLDLLDSADLDAKFTEIVRTLVASLVFVFGLESSLDTSDNI